MDKVKVQDLFGKEEAFRKVSLLVDIYHFLWLNKDGMSREVFEAFQTVMDFIADMEVEVEK